MPVLPKCFRGRFAASAAADTYTYTEAARELRMRNGNSELQDRRGVERGFARKLLWLIQDLLGCLARERFEVSCGAACAP